MSDIVIKVGLTEDMIGTIAEIEERCFTAPWSKGAFFDIMANGYGYHFVTAWDGYTIVGFGCLGSVLDEATVLNIATLPEMRRRGIGQKILSELISEAKRRECTVVMLEVRESNLPARSLYEKNGFVTVGERKNYYVNPTENAVLMDKKLGK